MTKPALKQKKTRLAILCMFFSKTQHILSLPCMPAQAIRLSVGLGDTLELVLLLDGVGVGRTLGGVDELLSKALGNRLDVAESGLTGTDGQEGDGLVDPPEGRDIDGLSPDGSLGTDSGRVLSGTGVDDGVNQDLHVSPKSANYVLDLVSYASAKCHAPGWGSGRSTSG